ncbi:MAG TPA: acyl-CoA dehydrogenase family protein [Pseudonocardia sp.]|jgi:alkylation response protein AidB-like acyl-CoA dehydrogenase|nr:acyl-CoA dehydrogenase family protein [Pseudonocardia sp.]
MTTTDGVSTTPQFVTASEEELRELRETAQRVLAVEERPEGGRTDRDRWRQLAELGWLGITVPEHLGGGGAGPDVAAVLTETAGHVGSPDPLAAAAFLPLAWLTELPASPAVDSVLAGVVDGSVLAAAAWQPESGDLDGTDVPVSLTSDPDGLTLSGRSSWVPLADADLLLVLATQDGEPHILACPTNQDGVTTTPVELADGSRWAHVEFSATHLPREAVLARGSEVTTALTAAVDVTLVLVAAELTGLSQRALDLTLEHLRTRQQFGRPLGSFQSAQHASVDMYIQVRLARAALGAAIAEWRRPGLTATERAAAASSAKARASIAARQVTTKAVHLHGALGFSDEYELGRYVNRGLVLSSFLGNAELHRRRHQQMSESDGSSETGGSAR